MLVLRLYFHYRIYMYASSEKLGLRASRSLHQQWSVGYPRYRSERYI